MELNPRVLVESFDLKNGMLAFGILIRKVNDSRLILFEILGVFLGARVPSGGRFQEACQGGDERDEGKGRKRVERDEERGENENPFLSELL